MLDLGEVLSPSMYGLGLLVVWVMLGDTLDAASSPHDTRASTVPWMGMAVED